MVQIDFYTGFENDNEIVISEVASNGKVVTELHLWYGYFVGFLGYMPLNENMHSDSVLYNWQQSEGFYENKWQCKRAQEFYDQLSTIGDKIPSEFQAPYIAIKQICESTLQNGNKFFIEYL